MVSHEHVSFWDESLARTLIQKTPKPKLQAANAKKAAKNPPKDNTEA
jgi:hypothetical protein